MSTVVFEPTLGIREMQLVSEALHSGMISGTAGPFIPRFEQMFAEYCGCAYGVAVNSGTAALHLAAVLAGIRPGDEVLVSACTNIASGNAVFQQGGTIVPVDSEPETWNMNPALLQGLITNRTKAILPVHIYGHPVDMNAVQAIAAEHGLFVIEDAAEAHGATYLGLKVGGFGDVGCFSFYANKIITTGEGGMLVTDDVILAERARSLRNLAFSEPRFYHREIGFNYRMPNLQAAIGVAQMERIESTIIAKRALARHYTERLSRIPALQLPVERDGCRNVYWMYCIVLKPSARVSRDALMAHLATRGIETRTMFCPLNLQPAYGDRVKRDACPVAENLWKNGLYLPSSTHLDETDVDRIARAIEAVV